jgi:hypothetical protein
VTSAFNAFLWSTCLCIFNQNCYLNVSFSNFHFPSNPAECVLTASAAKCRGRLPVPVLLISFDCHTPASNHDIQLSFAAQQPCTSQPNIMKSLAKYFGLRRPHSMNFSNFTAGGTQVLDEIFSDGKPRQDVTILRRFGKYLRPHLQVVLVVLVSPQLVSRC